MDKDVNRDGSETSPKISVDDIIYSSEVGIINSKLTNDQTSNLHGGYDSGVDSISCKSNASSSSNSDIFEEKVLTLSQYNKGNVPKGSKTDCCDNAKGLNHDWDPGTLTDQNQNRKFHAFRCTRPKYGWLVVFSCFWLNVIQAGIAFCGGIVLNVIAEEFGETRSRVSIISSFFNGFQKNVF